MERKPKFDWHPSPRRPRSPSSVSSSSAFSSRPPSFSSDAGDSFVSADDCFEEDEPERGLYRKEAVVGGYCGHAALQFVVPTSRYAWWRWRRKPRYHLSNVPDPSRASSKPGASSAHSTLTTCSTNSTLSVPSYMEGSPCDFHLTPRTEGEILSSPNLKAFTFSELKSATRNFYSLIGIGGFGYVFKGWIDEQTFTASKPGSGMVVAVKKLKPEGFHGYNEWLTEVNYHGQLHHPNLVKLIGFCLDGDNRLLIYEYMPRGSLENHLFRRDRISEPLSWAIRLKVAIGAAKVLSYLHDAESQVIYRDVKVSNILLDSEFNAKLSGFGYARAGPTGDETHVSTRVMGTLGYAAPEYILTGRLSAKADVYSFGVVLLELLSGRRAFDKTKSRAERNLVDWAKPYLSDKRKLFRFMDYKLEGQYPKNDANAVAMLALQCISNDAKLRPRMSEALAALEQLQDVKVAERLTHTEIGKLQSPGAGQSPSPLRPAPGGSPLLSSRRSPRVR